MLRWQEIQPVLCSLQESLSRQATCADGDLRLDYLIARAFWVRTRINEGKQAFLLIVSEHPCSHQCK